MAERNDVITAEPGLAADREQTLAVEGVSVRLGGREVLHDVRFTIRAGEFVGLIGSNGAGKTTLLRVILGLQKPSAGQVRIGGAARSGRGRSIGYVPQKIELDPDMPLRARDLVGLGLDGHRFGIPMPSRGRRGLVDEMLHAVGAAAFADARVGTLSGGEQQRVMIAHALISKPRLLLLDEPLANLDLRSEQEVVSLLARICAERGIAVLISAHEINPLLPVMDRVVYMAAGRAASGTTSEVVRPEVLTRLYGHHVDVIHLHGRVLVVAGRGDEPAVGPRDDTHVLHTDQAVPEPDSASPDPTTPPKACPDPTTPPKACPDPTTPPNACPDPTTPPNAGTDLTTPPKNAADQW